MRGWGSRTPKRTILWSNSAAVRLFRTDKKHSRSNNKYKLATTYHDRAGNKRYKGNRHMKGSQILGQIDHNDLKHEIVEIV